MHLRALHHLKNNIFNFLTFKKKLTPLCKIAFKYDTDKGKHRYTYYYHKLFKDSRKKSINILELGIYKGHSIKMWDEYFEKGNIYCLDHLSPENPLTENIIFNENTIQELENHSPKISAYICSQNEEDSLNTIFKSLSFDFIVDDASHFQKESLQSLGILFKKLNKGGIYIIEDMCTLWGFQTGSNWGQKFNTNKKEWLDHFLNTGELYDAKLFSDTIHYVLMNFIETNLFYSEYLSEVDNEYLTENIDYIEIINSPQERELEIHDNFNVPREPASVGSTLTAGSLAIIRKK
ncbi:MAG: hypothetical protein CMA43_00640 [Euryarchaeota archaeon]|nr:hypothetical protein [Euryarchaeota archaeon]